MKKIGIILLFSLLTGMATAQAPQKRLVNTDRNGLALKGHDPVAFFTAGRPVRGNELFESSFNGVRYRFASAENKQLFDAEPDRYEPQFGGFCAWAVSRGYTADVDLDAFQIVNGRLLMQYSKSVRDTFSRDAQGNLRKADENWPQIVSRKGK